MQTSDFTRFAAIASLALLAALPAQAQTPPSDAPPKLEKLEEGEPPTVTIRQPSTTSEITEKRSPGGEIQEIRVKSGGSSYILRPRQATGALPSDNISLPQWVIHEFDWGQPKPQSADKAQPQVLEPKK